MSRHLKVSHTEPMSSSAIPPDLSQASRAHEARMHHIFPSTHYPCAGARAVPALDTCALCPPDAAEHEQLWRARRPALPDEWRGEVVRSTRCRAARQRPAGCRRSAPHRDIDAAVASRQGGQRCGLRHHLELSTRMATWLGAAVGGQGDGNRLEDAMATAVGHGISAWRADSV